MGQRLASLNQVAEHGDMTATRRGSIRCKERKGSTMTKELKEALDRELDVAMESGDVNEPISLRSPVSAFV